MAVWLEFINLVIPIEVIKQKYPGGWDECLSDHANAIGKRVWYDQYLFRDGAMNPNDMGSLIEHWTLLGFTPHREVDGKLVEWVDMCVCEEMSGGATLKCDFLEYDSKNQSVYMKGTEPGEVAYPDKRDYDEQTSGKIFINRRHDSEDDSPDRPLSEKEKKVLKKRFGVDS